MAVKVGLTGGVGSGKSTAARCFAGLGVTVLDADAVGRELTAPGNAEFDAIVACFGAAVVGADGRLARKALARVVFGSAAQRRRLEAILHPPIRARMYAAAAADDGAYCVLDIPLLVETGQHLEMARVVTVACAREVRLARLVAGRGMSEDEVRRIMDSQGSEPRRLAAADEVIDNNRGEDEMTAQVGRLHRRFLGLYGGGSEEPLSRQ